MQEKKLFATIFSVLVVSMMIFVTIGTSTVMFASAQQPTNATGTAQNIRKEKLAVLQSETLLQFY